MNVFDVLYSGKRRVTEENISAFLAWMLDPSQSHGWGSTFLKRFLRAVSRERFERFIGLMRSHVAYRDRATVQATVVMEENVITTSGKSRDIDIVLYLEGDRDSIRAVLIENKIDDGAVSPNQLQDELEGFLNGEALAAPERVAVVYLTPQKSSATVRDFDSLSSHPGPTAHLSWSGTEETSIEHLIESMLEDEAYGRIEPLSTETRWLLKSFLRSIRLGFRARFQENAQTSGCRSEFFEGMAQGIEELRALAEEDGDLHVGFNGGTTALDAASREYLENRVFKYDSDPARGNKIPKNWLNIREVIQAYESKA